MLSVWLLMLKWSSPNDRFKKKSIKHVTLIKPFQTKRHWCTVMMSRTDVSQQYTIFVLGKVKSELHKSQKYLQLDLGTHENKRNSKRKPRHFSFFYICKHYNINRSMYFNAGLFMQASLRNISCNIYLFTSFNSSFI